MPREVCSKCKKCKSGVTLCADDLLPRDCDEGNDSQLANTRTDKAADATSSLSSHMSLRPAELTIQAGMISADAGTATNDDSKKASRGKSIAKSNKACTVVKRPIMSAVTAAAIGAVTLGATPRMPTTSVGQQLGGDKSSTRLRSLSLRSVIVAGTARLNEATAVKKMIWCELLAYINFRDNSNANALCHVVLGFFSTQYGGRDWPVS